MLTHLIMPNCQAVMTGKRTCFAGTEPTKGKNECRKRQADQGRDKYNPRPRENQTSQEN